MIVYVSAKPQFWILSCIAIHSQYLSLSSSLRLCLIALVSWSSLRAVTFISLYVHGVFHPSFDLFALCWLNPTISSIKIKAVSCGCIFKFLQIYFTYYLILISIYPIHKAFQPYKSCLVIYFKWTEFVSF